MENKVTSHITKGLIIALILIVLDIAGHLTGVRFETWYGLSVLALEIAFFIWVPIQFSNEMENNVTFGTLFGHGFKTAAVITSLFFVYSLLAVYVLFPNLIDQLIQQQFEKAAESGRDVPTLSADQMQMAKKVTTVFFFAGVVLGTLVIGVIGTLIGAAIAKKKPRDPFGNQTI